MNGDLTNISTVQNREPRTHQAAALTSLTTGPATIVSNNSIVDVKIKPKTLDKEQIATINDTRKQEFKTMTSKNADMKTMKPTTAPTKSRYSSDEITGELTNHTDHVTTSQIASEQTSAPIVILTEAQTTHPKVFLTQGLTGKRKGISTEALKINLEMIPTVTPTASPSLSVINTTASATTTTEAATTSTEKADIPTKSPNIITKEATSNSTQKDDTIAEVAIMIQKSAITTTKPATILKETTAHTTEAVTTITSTKEATTNLEEAKITTKTPTTTEEATTIIDVDAASMSTATTTTEVITIATEASTTATEVVSTTMESSTFITGGADTSTESINSNTEAVVITTKAATTTTKEATFPTKSPTAKPTTAYTKILTADTDIYTTLVQSQKISQSITSSPSFIYCDYIDFSCTTHHYDGRYYPDQKFSATNQLYHHINNMNSVLYFQHPVWYLNNPNEFRWSSDTNDIFNTSIWTENDGLIDTEKHEGCKSN